MLVEQIILRNWTNITSEILLVACLIHNNKIDKKVYKNSLNYNL